MIKYFISTKIKALCLLLADFHVLTDRVVKRQHFGSRDDHFRSCNKRLFTRYLSFFLGLQISSSWLSLNFHNNLQLPSTTSSDDVWHLAVTWLRINHGVTKSGVTAHAMPCHALLCLVHCLYSTRGKFEQSISQMKSKLFRHSGNDAMHSFSCASSLQIVVE